MVRSPRLPLLPLLLLLLFLLIPLPMLVGCRAAGAAQPGMGPTRAGHARCGHGAVHLVRRGGAGGIAGLAYTVQRTGCPPAPPDR